MKIVFALIPALLVTTTFAQDFERIAPKVPSKRGDAATVIEPPPPKSAMPGRPPLPRATQAKGGPALRGLVFVTSTKVAKGKGVPRAPGITVRGIPLLETPAFQARMKRYLGQPLTFDLVNTVAQDVNAFYIERDRPVVNVTAPEQDVTSGVVQIVVTEGVVGEVRVEGNRWFRTSLFRNTVRLREGEPVLKSRLDADLAQLNANPFRTVESTFKPGTARGTTDVVLKVEDRFPLRAYAGYENTGTLLTGEDRWIAGFNWGNALWLDHQFNYQFTTSSDFAMDRAHSGSYIIPLPWRHTLTFFGSYEETEPEVPQDFGQQGKSSQVSMRYSIPLRAIRAYKHEIVLGFDYKNTNNNLIFGGSQVFDTSLDVLQFVVSYIGAFPDPLGRTSFEGTLFASPGNWTAKNEEANFEAARAGADPRYLYALARLSHLAPLPKGFVLSNQFTAQLASGPLVGTEQLGFGGYNSVRGYAEQVVNGDSGFIMNHEVRTPALHPLKWAGVGKLEDSLQFLAFWDFGIAKIKDAAPGQDSSISLSSIGIGARYTINPYLSARADYGWQLLDVAGDPDSGRFSLGVTISY